MKFETARRRIDRLELLDAVLAVEQRALEKRGEWTQATRIIGRRERIIRAQGMIATRFLSTPR